MAKQIAKLLKADLNSTSNLALIAKMLEKKGRANDTILAHISKKEANLLKELGGSGTVNPETGLLEFFDEEFTSGDIASQQFPDYGAPTPEATASLPFTTGPEPLTDVPAAPSSAAYSAPSATDFGASYGLQQTGTTGVQAKVPTDFGPTIPASPKLGYGVTDTVAPTAAQELASAPQEKSFLDKLTKNLTSQDMIRLGLAGGLGTLGYTKSKQAAKQAEQAAGEQKALAAPYQTQGQELIRAAQAGELSPTGQQALQAQRAQLAQGVESRGGVGAQQAAAQAEAFRQQLLQQQYNYGLQIAQVGDSIALGAIKTGLQADQAVNQATQNFYTSLAMVAGGIPMTRS